MERDREFRDLPLPVRLICFFVLTVALTAVVIGGIARANADRCSAMSAAALRDVGNSKVPWQ